VSENGRWLQIKALFEQSQQQPEGERETWLAGQCADDLDLLRAVLDLLSAQRASPGIFDGGAAGVLERLYDDEPVADLVGQRVGAYRLLRLVGEGGMGRVYLAEREDGGFTHRAALKLIRAEFMSEEARTRFVRERKILAGLQHPNIAQLHDGGVADDSTPYFTLEYIEGQPITKYCDDRSLDIRRRIALILQVCGAVAYAHRNLVVHRDLKPSNILVTADGEAKLLDFGIAKLLDADTGEGKTATLARMMTPEYAAPEQVLGEPITTATDVYAIGVLLYELLCGRLPYARADAGAISWAKAVVEEAPESFNRALIREGGTTQRPSGETAAAARGMTLPSLRRVLRGDLDRIVQRALAKEPDARYPSVIAIADDLRAFVDGRAISGGSRRYRLRKFARRHWLPLAAGAVLLLTLSASGMAIVWQARQTAHEARTTRAVKDFLFGLFTAVDPREAKGREISAHELLDRGAKRIERNRLLDAEQKAEIEGSLGRIYYQLGLFDPAGKLQENAIQALSATSAQALLLAQTEAERADTLNDLGDMKAATVLADDAMQKVDALPEATPIDRARALHARARIALNQRDFAAAKRYAIAELAIAHATEVDAGILFKALLVAGGASWGLTENDAAESYYREALAVASRDADPDDLDVAVARTDVAMALANKSRFQEQEQLEQLALATEEKVLGPDHPLTMALHRDLGLAYYHLGNYAQARAAFEQVLAAQRAKLGNDSPAIAGTEINLGLVLADSGDLDAAERASRDALSVFQTKYGRQFQGTQLALGDLGAVHMLQGKLDSAEAELVEVSDQEKKVNPDDKGSVVTNYRLGELKRLRGDAQAAVEIQRNALAIAQKKNGESSRFTAMAHHLLALALRDQGDNTGAERELRAALASYAGYIPQAEHPLAAQTRFELGLLLLKRDATSAEGIRLLTEAVGLYEKFLGKDELRTKQARAALEQARKSCVGSCLS
jgi:serine/threonine-protein kinase